MIARDEFKKPNFDDVYGITANPIRLIFMIGILWHLSKNRDTEGIQITEVGCWTGSSTLTWGQAIDEYFNGKGEITSIDPWMPYVDIETNQTTTNKMMNAALEENRIFDVFIRNTSFLSQGIDLKIMREPSSSALTQIKKNSQVLVYIDGDHTYENVKNDIENSIPLVKERGILCGDDLEIQLHECDETIYFLHPLTDEAYSKKQNKRYHPGVTRAVGEILGPVSVWDGFWAMQKNGKDWNTINLKNMPIHIPKHLHSKSLIGLKSFLMQNDLFQ